MLLDHGLYPDSGSDSNDTVTAAGPHGRRAAITPEREAPALASGSASSAQRRRPHPAPPGTIDPANLHSLAARLHDSPYRVRARWEVR